jgi:hypothetical protein
VDGHRREVLGDVVDLVFVEVVADPRPVRQEMLDGDGVVDQGEIFAEHRPSGRLEVQRPVLDETHDRERREPLGAARDPEPGSECVRYRVRTVGETERIGVSHLSRAVVRHHPGEVGALRLRLDRGSERGHAATLREHDVASELQLGSLSRATCVISPLPIGGVWPRVSRSS